MNPNNRNVLKVGLCLLSALAGLGCESSKGLKRSGDGGQKPDSDVVPLAGDSGLGPDGKGNSAPVDAGGCGSLRLPDVDCLYGSPSYTCVERDGRWSWFTSCPQSPPIPDPSVDSGAPPSADCDLAVDRLLGEMTTEPGACTAVVRLDYSTLTILSHAFVCGKYAAVSEASARRAADALPYDPGSAKAGVENLLSGGNATDQWIFSMSPSDFGGVTAVSGHTGLVTFAGSIVWSGNGDIVYPKTWSTTDLGKGCNTLTPWDTRTYDLTEGRGTDLNMMEAARIVLSTALPTAFGHWGSVLGTTVLLYPRAVGDFDPKTAEFIVLLDGGWLE